MIRRGRITGIDFVVFLSVLLFLGNRIYVETRSNYGLINSTDVSNLGETYIPVMVVIIRCQRYNLNVFDRETHYDL